MTSLIRKVIIRDNFYDFLTSRDWTYPLSTPKEYENRIRKQFKMFKDQYKSQPQTIELYEFLGLTKSQYNIYLTNIFQCVKLLLILKHRWNKENSKLILVDGIPHRNRRGKVVPIPLEWFGRFTYEQNIRERKSKLIRKLR